MRSKVKILFVALVLFVCACSPKGDGTVTVVDVEGSKMAVFSIDELKSNTVTVPLSSLVENCELVQLETTEEAFFNSWFTTVTDKYIGVRDQRREFKLFDRSGKFLCNVGSIGQGPGEYTAGPYDAIIDDQNDLIYLSPFGGDKILVYNTSGRFMKDIVTPHRLQKAKIFLSNGILTVIHMPFQNNRAIAFQFDTNTGEVLRELAPPPHFTVSNLNGDIVNTRNAPEIFDFAFMENDTLYHYDMKNNKILPAFKMTYSSSEKPWMVYFQMNKDLFLTNVSFLGIDPSTGRQRYIPRGLVATDLKNKTSSYITVLNDYFGNMPVKVDYFTFFHGHYVLNIQPEELIGNIEEYLAQSGRTEAEKQMLQSLRSTLKENGNNVVFIGKIKSDIRTKLF
jgi:hypothetical protein